MKLVMWILSIVVRRTSKLFLVTSNKFLWVTLDLRHPYVNYLNPLFNLCWIFWCWLMTDNNGYWKWCTNSCCNTWFTNRCYNMWCLILNITMGDNCNPNHFLSKWICIMDYIAFLKHQMNLSNFMSWMSMCKYFLLIEVHFHIFCVKLFTYKFVWWTHHIINRHEILHVWHEQSIGHKIKNY